MEYLELPVEELGCTLVDYSCLKDLGPEGFSVSFEFELVYAS